MADRFPASIEEVTCAGPDGSDAIVLRVRVLSMVDGIPHHEALKTAIRLAVGAAGAGEEEQTEDQQRELSIRERQALNKVMIAASRDAITHYRWPDEDEWRPLRVAANPQDERRDAGVYCVTTMDQVAPDWHVAAGNIALRAVAAAAGKVRPLSETGS